MEILYKFIEMSELVSNENMVIYKVELGDIIKNGGYQYIKLNFTTIYDVESEIEKNGIENALVEADLAIAETGTVVFTNSTEKFRRATSLCENLHVVLPQSKIVQSLEDSAVLLRGVTKKAEGSFVAFVTGASRTADIEMSLSLGVHGPQSMRIFIIRDL